MRVYPTYAAVAAFASFFFLRPCEGATCGNGHVGDGICAEDPSMCCSSYGYCGYSPEYCDGANPGPCGDGHVGNGICADPSMCCSSSGYCGYSPEYCDGANSGPCGDGHVGNGICADQSMCCSEWGYCGYSPEYCNGPPCGDGHVGHGVCADPSMCCSEFGYCGYGPDYCNGPNPAPVPPPAPSTPVTVKDDSRMIAYMAYWQDCPTAAQLEQYTHVVIAFAGSHTSSAPYCDQSCNIPTPPVCDYRNDWGLLDDLRAQGKKIMVSFGGPQMGDSSPGGFVGNGCWEYCYGKETHVVDQLTRIVNELGADGVDIEYEYYYEDGQNGSNFNKGAEARHFLREVTLGLHSSLPHGSIVTHSPKDTDMVPGSAYYDLLRDIRYSLSFLMPMYYSTTDHDHDFSGAFYHYSRLVDEFFDGDATRMVLGFCIKACYSSASGPEAEAVMEELTYAYPCNGGASFWSAELDSGASWSSVVNQAVQVNAGCSSVNAVGLFS